MMAQEATIGFTVTSQARRVANETTRHNETRNGLNPADFEFRSPYELEILTVAEFVQDDIKTEAMMRKIARKCSAVPCQIGDATGLGGHVMLSYPPSERSLARFKKEKLEEEQARAIAIEAGKYIPQGHEAGYKSVPARGRILASAGHWTELMKLDVGVEEVFSTVRDERGPGTAIYNDLAARITRGMDTIELTNYTNTYVTTRIPATYNPTLVRQRHLGY